MMRDARLNERPGLASESFRKIFGPAALFHCLRSPKSSVVPSHFSQHRPDTKRPCFLPPTVPTKPKTEKMPERVPWKESNLALSECVLVALVLRCMRDACPHSYDHAFLLLPSVDASVASHPEASPVICTY